MGKSVINLLERLQKEYADKSVVDAVIRVYNKISDSMIGIYESTLSEELASEKCLGNNTIHHGSYVRTALDILGYEDFIVRIKGKYFVRN